MSARLAGRATTLRPKEYLFHAEDVSDAYAKWPQPDLIVSDGAYGVRGFKGDTDDETGLAEWYAPHVVSWSEHAKPSTSLWFWNTEVGWATVHPLLVACGWRYVQLVVWDKGMAHVAGNVNGKTIRQFPIASEVSALYRRRVCLRADDDTELPVKEWLRHEWQRSGLALHRANEACGVKNAATRKYLTTDWLWYWPPGQAVESMAAYCAEHGKRQERPCFSLDGATLPKAEDWDALRATWNHESGFTNVWPRLPLADEERVKMKGRSKSLHLNQKPLELMRRQIAATTNEGDVVWEPFGGLCSASVAALAMGRVPCAAERIVEYQESAISRLKKAACSR